MSAKIFDCLVLSGGGAKGSYGAGAAHALCSYYQLKGSRELCLIGTSAGALNACVLASHDSAKLTNLWQSQVSNEAILGTKYPWLKTRFLQGLILKKPFHVFPNSYLRNLIKQNVDFDKLAGKHLILLTTDLINGKLTAFYVSDLMEKFVRFDEDAATKQNDQSKRRLRHLRKIDNKDALVSALLASAAIPVFFPPVKIGDRYHVDGGVGNNTPTREAAYFLRFLSEMKEGVPGDVYCIQQDEPAIATQGEPDMSFFGLLKRTIEVTQYIHMKPIIAAWNRINVEVKNHEDKLKDFSGWLQATSYGADVKEAVSKELRERFGRLGGVAVRINIPLISVQPSTSLGDTLDFNPEAMRRNVKHGYQDMLKALRAEEKITDFDYETLSNRLP